MYVLNHSFGVFRTLNTFFDFFHSTEFTGAREAKHFSKTRHNFIFLQSGDMCEAETLSNRFFFFFEKCQWSSYDMAHGGGVILRAAINHYRGNIVELQ